MKRFYVIILALVLAFILAVDLTGCNRQVVDLHYSFKDAMIQLPDGSIVQGKLESWRDYENSDQIQVKIDGVTYLVHSVNCVLYN